MIDKYKKFVINIKGKDYMTVAGRVSMFWDEVKPEETASIITDVKQEGQVIMVKAVVTRGSKMSVGHASETIGKGMINLTSALENCETSAVGRALGNFGLGLIGAGGIASADEVTNAISKQTTLTTPKKKTTQPEEIKEEDIPVINQDEELSLEQEGRIFDLICSNGDAKITEAEKAYSTRMFGRPLCRTCQAAAKKDKLKQ